MSDADAIDRVFRAMMKNGNLKMGALAKKAWNEAKEILKRHPELLER